MDLAEHLATSGLPQGGIESTKDLGLKPLDIYLQDIRRWKTLCLTERIAWVNGELHRLRCVIPGPKKRVNCSLRILGKMHRQLRLDITQTYIQDLNIAAIFRPLREGVET